MIVGLSGYAQVGKDTAAQVFERYGFVKYSFADPMREMALEIDPWVPSPLNQGYIRYSKALEVYGYEEAKRLIPEVREFLQRLGTNAGRKILGEDIWVNTAMKRMTTYGGDWVVPDVRFPNEADAIALAGGYVFRIERPDHGPANDHPSETSLDEYPYFDDTIHNDWTIDDLHTAVWESYMELEGHR